MTLGRGAIAGVTTMVEYNFEEGANGVHVNGTSKPSPARADPPKRCLWFEEELEEDLRWVFGVSKYAPPFFPLPPIISLLRRFVCTLTVITNG